MYNIKYILSILCILLFLNNYVLAQLIEARTAFRECSAKELEDCLSFFNEACGTQFQFVQLTVAQLNTLCSVRPVILNCLKTLAMQCFAPMSVLGIVRSYEYLCLNKHTYEKYRAQFARLTSVRTYFSIFPLMIAAGIDSSVDFVHQSPLLNPLYKELDSTLLLYSLAARRMFIFRELLFTEYVVSMNIDEEASNWHSKFYRLLASGPFLVPNAVNISRLLENNTAETLTCSSMKRAELKGKCRLAGRCVDVYYLISRASTFGILYTASETEMQIICDMTPEKLAFCVENIAPLSSLPDRLLLKSLQKPIHLICNEQRYEYVKYKPCLTSLFSEPSKRGLRNCSDRLVDSFSQIVYNVDNMRQKDSQRFICNIAADYLDCLEGLLLEKCSVEEALWQRSVSRFVFAEAFEGFFCYNVFSYRDREDGIVRISKVIKDLENENYDLEYETNPLYRNILQ